MRRNGNGDSGTGAQSGMPGKVPACAIEPNAMEKELRYRTEMEEMISSIAARLVSSGPDTDALMNGILRDLGEFENAAGCCLCRIGADPDMPVVTHGWNAFDGESGMEAAGILRPGDASRALERLVKGEIVTGPDTACVRPAGARRNDGEGGARAFVAVPFVCGEDRMSVVLWRDNEAQDWAEGTMSLLKIVAGMLATALEKWKVLADLDTERQLFDALMDNMPDHIYFKDAESRFLRMNAAQAERFGLGRPEDAVGKTDFDFFSEEHAGQAYADEQEVIRTGKAIIGKEEKETWPDGRETWVLTTKMPLFINGRITGTFGISRDVTQRKKAQMDLAKERELLRTLIDNLPGAHVYVKDLESRFITTNSAHLKLLGLDRLEEAVGRTDKDFFPRQQAEKYLADERTVLSTGKAMINIEETTLDREGNEIALLTSKVPLRENDGSARGLLGISTDITALKMAESDRMKMERQMQQAQKLESLGVLSGGIAHDFNNLLMSMLANTGMALSEVDPESRVWNYLKQIETTAIRASELTNQMLAYCGKSKIVFKPVDVSSLVREMGDILRVSISGKVTINYELADNLPYIEGDASQIRQVVMNLITNASDAVDGKRGTVTIRTCIRECGAERLAGCYVGKKLKPGRYVCIEVSDTGCGMDAETMNRMFDPFFTTKVKGRGLGLASVLGIVRGHNGAMKVYSEVGKGSDLKLMFPAGGKLEIAGNRGRTKVYREFGGLTALVVDDDEAILNVAEQMLARMGFKVLVADNESSGIRQCRQAGGNLAVIIMDLTIPGVSGEKLLAELRKASRCKVPLILISGYSESAAPVRLPPGSYEAFLQKPFTADMLGSTLEKVLKSA